MLDRHTSHTHVRAVFVAVIILVIASAILLVWPKTPYFETSVTPHVELHSQYECAEGKSIDAWYYSDHVRIELSDIRTVTLYPASSDSGKRYVTDDAYFVFWNKKKDAFLQEGNTLTFVNCVTK